MISRVRMGVQDVAYEEFRASYRGGASAMTKSVAT